MTLTPNNISKPVAEWMSEAWRMLKAAGLASDGFLGTGEQLLGRQMTSDPIGVVKHRQSVAPATTGEENIVTKALFVRQPMASFVATGMASAIYLPNKDIAISGRLLIVAARFPKRDFWTLQDKERDQLAQHLFGRSFQKGDNYPENVAVAIADIAECHPIGIADWPLAGFQPEGADKTAVILKNVRRLRPFEVRWFESRRGIFEIPVRPYQLHPWDGKEEPLWGDD